MINRATVIAAILVGLTFDPVPALGETTSAPPGNPCATGNGNPCNGNQGNAGAQGNAKKKDDGITINTNAAPISIAMPAVSGRAAYINQVGEGNSASISQSATNAYGRIRQAGSRNTAVASQHGSGSAYLEVNQAGDLNSAAVSQDGPGENVLYLSQSGSSNVANASQYGDGPVHNGAHMVQAGFGNVMELGQSGSNNAAILEQQGNGNQMTAFQSGGSQLTWLQQGTNLSNLHVVQNGGALGITQVNPTGR